MTARATRSPRGHGVAATSRGAATWRPFDPSATAIRYDGARSATWVRLGPSPRPAPA